MKKINDSDISVPVEFIGSPVAFFGICEKANSNAYDHAATWHQNILGLKQNFISSIYPVNLNSINLIIGIYDLEKFQGGKLIFKNVKEEQIFHINISPPQISNIFEGNASDVSSIIKNTNSVGWSLITFKINFDALIMEPGLINVYFDYDGKSWPVGFMTANYRKAPKLTPEIIAGLKSNPQAAKKVIVEISCSTCNESLKAYAGFERDKILEKDGSIWYEEVPNLFKCKCIKSYPNLKYVKENLHALLGTPIIGNRMNLKAIEMYNEAAIKNIINGFEKLINSKPLEGPVQKYIEENLLILQSFNPQQIFIKSPILTEHKTDFCILNHKKELFLVEIEKPDTQIMKLNGHTNHELQHAIDQVNDWIHCFKEEKSAILRSMKLKPEDVSMIKGVVIAGRDTGWDKDKLHKLKGKNLGDVSFYTYDDILGDLYTLLQNLNKI